MVSVIVLSFVVVGRRTTSDYEEARWPPARPRAALRQKAPRAASYTTPWGTTNASVAEEFLRRIKEGTASSSDLAAAVRFLSHNRIEAEDDEVHREKCGRALIGDIEYPFK